MSRITRLFQPAPAPLPSLRGLALLLAGATLLGATTLATRTAPSEPARMAASPAVRNLPWDQVKVRLQPDPPAYPPDAKKKRIQGTVVVELVIDENGIPVRARATKGPQPLRETAVTYALGWRFEPVLAGGKPVPARFKLTMPFRLR